MNTRGIGYAILGAVSLVAASLLTPSNSWYVGVQIFGILCLIDWRIERSRAQSPENER